MKEVWLTENCDEGLGELFKSTVREQMMSCNTVMYDSHSLVYVIIKPVLFFHPITVLLHVDHEHKNNFSKCWHTPWLLRKEKSTKKVSKYYCRNNASLNMVLFLSNNLDEICVFYSIMD